MNKVVRRLLSGASLATLQLCAAGIARASAPVVVSSARGPVTVTAHQNPDYIEVTSLGSISGNLTNEGTVGPGNQFGISLDFGAHITGSVINAKGGVINASHTGIAVASDVNLAGISNSGMIEVAHTASGSDLGNGIFYAGSNGAKLTNTGHIDVVANAAATATSFVNAQADGVTEQLFGAGGFAASLDNVGVISAKAHAALTRTGAASDSAIVHGVIQSVRTNNPSSTIGNGVTLSVDNSGTIDLAATAVAKGSMVTAIAHSAIGIQQQVSAFANISESITNSASFSLKVKASAVATGDAKATAFVSEGAYQKAEAAGLSGEAIKVSLTNSGTFAISDTAVAAGGPRASALAEFGSAFGQFDGFAQTISEDITNSGSVTVKLNAVANASVTHATTATAGAARAAGSLGYIAFQEGFSFTSGGVLDTVKLALTNSGSMSVTGNIKAVGKSFASAHVQAHSAFILQDAEYGNSTVSMNNSGTIAVSLTGDAEAGGEAEAQFNVGRLIEQEIVRPEQTGEISFINSGQISLSLNGIAKGMAPGNVTANVEAGAVLSQSIGGAAVANETVTNSGSMIVSVNAVATGGADAQADAGGGNVIYQQAEDSPGATLIANNKGQIGMRVFASASGTAEARVFAGGGGIEQFAPSSTAGGAPLDMSITNSGTISLDVAAQAKGQSAEVNVQGDGVAQGVRRSSGSLSFTNSGSVSVAAAGTRLATGTAPATTLTALRVVAYGYFVSGIGTNSSAHVAKANLSAAVNNSGSISVSAKANGSLALAAAVGIDIGVLSEVLNTSTGAITHTSREQHTGGAVKGILSNSGTVAVMGSAPQAKAEAYGVLVSGSTVEMPITNTSSGKIAVAATGATATAHGMMIANGFSGSTDHRHSFASGSNQVFSGSEINSDLIAPAASISGALTNNGTIQVQAKGTKSAKADGMALDGLDVSSDIVNAGTIDVTAAGPSATARGIHVYAARTGFVEQTAFRTVKHGFTVISRTGSASHHTVSSAVGGGTFSGRVSNSGTISVAASGANALASGIDIETDNVTGAFANSGKITATATGSNAKAAGVTVAVLSDDSPFLNTGTISSVATGSGASAVGVRISASSLGSAASFANDGGSIIARVNGL
ncbi:MAG TPA: hypothetical protein VIM56_10910, partial [Rhizomicrobium sp.]